MDLPIDARNDPVPGDDHGAGGFGVTALPGRQKARPLESGEVDESQKERKNDGYPALKGGHSGFIPPTRLTRRIAMTVSASTTFWGDFRVGGKLTTP